VFIKLGVDESIPRFSNSEDSIYDRSVGAVLNSGRPDDILYGAGACGQIQAAFYLYLGDQRVEMGLFDEFMLNGLKVLGFLGSDFFPLTSKVVTAGRQTGELV